MEVKSFRLDLSTYVCVMARTALEVKHAFAIRILPVRVKRSVPNFELAVLMACMARRTVCAG